MIAFIIGRDTINVNINTDGKLKTFVVARSEARAQKVIDLCREAKVSGNTSALEEVLSPGYRIPHLTNGDFEFDGSNYLYLKGDKTPIPELLAERILDFIGNNFPIDALVKFWKNCLLNPDQDAVRQLYLFLEHNGHPITDNGYFLAYKKVNIKKEYDTATGEVVRGIIGYDGDTGKVIYAPLSDSMVFTSIHNGPHGGTIKIGTPVSMSRAECDADSYQTCSKGLHVGSMAYVGHEFGSGTSPIIEVLVNPRNVVSVPVDYKNTKMRVCEYYPIGICNGEHTQTFLESDYKAQEDQAIAEELAARNKAISDAAAETLRLQELTK